MSEPKPTVLLALSPLVEQQMAPLLFGQDAAVTVAVSLVELAALDRTLADGTHDAEALLVSADQPDLSASVLSRARSHGLRLVGVAADEHDHALLQELPLDAILDTPAAASVLQAAVRSSSRSGEEVDAPTPQRQNGSSPHRREHVGTVLAVVGSRGAPGASELACSLAALAARRWTCLLVELDLLGSGGLAVRLGADASQGSLLALLRATRSGEPALAELVERWLTERDGWPPALLAPPQPEQVIDELDQPGAIRTALESLTSRWPLVVADVGSLLSQPGQPGPVERCHREALVSADAVLLVLGARETQLDAGLAQLDLLLETLGILRERIRVVCTGVDGPGVIPRQQLEQTLTIGLRERELAAGALIPWDSRALAKAVRTGLPLSASHPRGGYARAVDRLLDTLFLPGAPIARGRKRPLVLPSKPKATPQQSTQHKDEEEVALPWRS